MRLPPAAILLIGGTLYIGLLLTAQGAMFPVKQPPEPFKDRTDFCSLLQQEIKLDHTAGLIAKDTAEAIIANCFNNY